MKLSIKILFIISLSLILVFSHKISKADSDTMLISKCTIYGSDSGFVRVGFILANKRYSFCTYLMGIHGPDSLLNMSNSFGNMVEKDSFETVIQKAIAHSFQISPTTTFNIATKNFKNQVGEFYSSCQTVISNKNKISDPAKWTIGVGVNFDFLNPNVSFANIIYGETKYINDGLLNHNSQRWDLGIDIGGNYGTSIVQGGSITRSDFDFVPLSATQYDIIQSTYTSTQKTGFQQLSLSFETYAMMSVGKNNNLKIGIGPHFELYDITSYSTYSNTSLIGTPDTTIKTVPSGTFIPSGTSSLSDSTGVNVAYSYIGIVIPIVITEDFLIARAKFILGDVLGKEFGTPQYQNIIKGNAFYYMSVSLTEPHTQISLQANIRGSYPDKSNKSSYLVPVPIYNIYITKHFDLATLFKNLSNIGKG